MIIQELWSTTNQVEMLKTKQILILIWAKKKHRIDLLPQIT